MIDQEVIAQPDLTQSFPVGQNVWCKFRMLKMKIRFGEKCRATVIGHSLCGTKVKVRTYIGDILYLGPHTLELRT